jgi:hypothetical protein
MRGAQLNRVRLLDNRQSGSLALPIVAPAKAYCVKNRQDRCPACGFSDFSGRGPPPSTGRQSLPELGPGYLPMLSAVAFILRSLPLPVTRFLSKRGIF